MSDIKNKRNLIAIWLGILQLFICIGAIPAGLLMIINPSGVGLSMSVEMLINSPFPNFFIPGIFLLAVNGIGSLLGGVASFMQYRFSGKIAMGLGIWLILWIVVQVWWLGIHWLHFLYFSFGLIELVLGLRLRRQNMDLIQN